MAVDEALLRLSTVPVLRVYSWTEPAVSIGYFQKPSVVPAGRTWVRRYTGGGLVDHAADVTYTVVLQASHPLFIAGTGPCYRALHEAVSTALVELGHPVQLAETNDPENDACFQRPVLYDVVLQGLKVAGAAQRRTRAACLHQGSILVPGLTHADVSAHLPSPLAKKIGADQIQPSDLTAEESALAEELTASRYSRDEWNLQRTTFLSPPPVSNPAD